MQKWWVWYTESWIKDTNWQPVHQTWVLHVFVWWGHASSNQPWSSILPIVWYLDNFTCLYYQLCLRKHLRLSPWLNITCRTSLAVQWLRLHASTAGGTGSIPGQGTKILHAVRPKPNQKKERSKQTKNHITCIPCVHVYVKFWKEKNNKKRL